MEIKLTKIDQKFIEILIESFIGSKNIENIAVSKKRIDSEIGIDSLRINQILRYLKKSNLLKNFNSSDEKIVLNMDNQKINNLLQIAFNNKILTYKQKNLQRRLNWKLDDIRNQKNVRNKTEKLFNGKYYRLICPVCSYFNKEIKSLSDLEENSNKMHKCKFGHHYSYKIDTTSKEIQIIITSEPVVLGSLPLFTRKVDKYIKS